MKKLLIIALLFVSATAFSQKSYSIFRMQTGKYNGKSWTWALPRDINMTATLSGIHVFISDQADTHITTYEDLGEKADTDNDGTPYTSHSWKAYDEKNRKCLFSMQNYKEESYLIYYIMYNDMCFRYYVDREAVLDKF